jgi:capsular exopolysaccharide synthesis family protein
MDLHSYVQAVRKYWWLVLIVTLAGVGLGVAATVTATPRYESTVTFFVSTPPTADGTALQADQYAQRRVNSYVGLLTSERLADQIIATGGIDLTPAEVSASITASADLNTVLLSATVTDTSAQRSLAIATALATQFGELVDELDNNGSPENANVVLNVISGPTLNPNPVSPRPTLNVGLGLLVGLAVGLALAILRRVMDTTIRTPQLLQKATDVPVLGVMVADRAARKSPVIVDSNSRSIRAEAFRQLRTNLQFTNAARPVGVLVVTSSVAGEGKSSTSTNLALIFAADRRRVLLIDADLRRPKIADYLGLEGAVGLTNVLAGQAAIDDVLQEWGDSGLTVLPSGTIPPNPSELLGGDAMAEMLTTLRGRFDMIVIDTPPLLPVTDAAVASRLADGAILVVRYGKTTRHQISTALRSLAAVDARVLGTVLAMTPNKGAEAYKTYGYYTEDKKRGRRSAKRAVPAVPAQARAAGPAVTGAATSNATAAASAAPGATATESAVAVSLESGLEAEPTAGPIGPEVESIESDRSAAGSESPRRRRGLRQSSGNHNA